MVCFFFFFFDGLPQHVDHQNPRILNEACPTEEVVLRPAERRRYETKSRIYQHCHCPNELSYWIYSGGGLWV